MSRSQEHDGDEAGGGIPRSQIERLLLGSLVLWPNEHRTVCEDLTAEHFASAANRRIYSALVCMHKAEEPVDLVTVRDRLLEGDDLKDVGWPEYLIDLAEQTQRAFHGAVGTDYLRGPAELRSAGIMAEMRRYAKLLRELGPSAAS